MKEEGTDGFPKQNDCLQPFAGLLWLKTKHQMLSVIEGVEK